MNKLTPLWIFRVIRSVLLLILTLVTGLALGFWLGQTSLGQWFPRLFAVGTGVTFVVALAVSLRPGRLAADQTLAATPGFFYLCLLLASVILGSSVSAIPVWQLSSMDRIAGFMPYSDAGNYYRQVLAWPEAHFGAWNSRRPLNAALNIFEFHIGGSTLLGMQLVRVGLAAVAISAFIVALANLVGVAASLAGGFALLIWTWPYASSLFSEINGITMASASFALLLVALSRQLRWLAYLGLFGLVLAYAFRPYNPLMPAMFAVATAWVLWGRSGRPWKLSALALAVAAIFLVLAVPKAIYTVYGDPEGSVNANTGLVMLGLARGTNWTEAREFIAKKQPGLPEREASALMYRTSLATALTDPTPLLKALAVSGSRAVFQLAQEMGGAFGLSKQLVGDAQDSFGAFVSFVVKHPSIWFASLLLGGGVMACFWVAKSNTIVKCLGAASIISFISIAPVVFTDGNWRIVATLYPGLALLIPAIPMALGNWFAEKRVAIKESAIADLLNTCRQRTTIVLGAAVILIMASVAFYPAVDRWATGNSPYKPLAMTIMLAEGARPHWVAFNLAIIAPDHLQHWAASEEYTGLQDFVYQHGRDIVRIGYEPGMTIIYVVDSLLISAPWRAIDNNRFIVRPISEFNRIE